MQKIDVIEYLPKIMTELKRGILLNTKQDNSVNTMTIAWGQIGIEWSKLFFTAYVRHSRFTHEQIEKSKEFTISVPVERTPEIAKIMSYCGSKSGRDVNKFADCNLTIVDGIDVNSPAIKEIPLTIECKVIYSQEQETHNIPDDAIASFYPEIDDIEAKRDFHTVYYGEIVNAYLI
ncbi:flavin reductase family protein [bacterium]|nr:flavin reductase family protein [bacterium]